MIRRQPTFTLVPYTTLFRSEQAARMVAMKAATDNGANLINELQIVYNKARQGAITNELIDIVSGAAAVSG